MHIFGFEGVVIPEKKSLRVATPELIHNNEGSSIGIKEPEKIY
ncbi:hypothetical protein FACS189459_7020 [Bacilli bacterium]|nr:hypothetical protein FACS189459_7020 [Bacilli bacterium]